MPEWSKVKLYPLNSRLVIEDGRTFRYVIDKDGYGWIPERQWQRKVRKWLRRTKYEFILTTGEIVKA